MITIIMTTIVMGNIDHITLEIPKDWNKDVFF